MDSLISKESISLHNEIMSLTTELNGEKDLDTTIKIERGVIKISDLFSNNNHYIYARHNIENTPINLISILKFKEDTIESIYFKSYGITYLGDYFFDVNNDGINEYIIKWQASSGCCMRESEDIHFLNIQGDSLKMKSLLNPTYFKTKKQVVTLSYCHWGNNCELELYKWNNNTIDTISKVSYVTKNGETFFIYKNYKTFSIDTLNTLSSPFKDIKSDYLDWFGISK